VWAGAVAGLAASVGLGVAAYALLGEAFSGENRELMEGITGLAAAAMLLYVSYWLHSKSSLGAWQRYISQSTQRALARGSLAGLALLSFLAIFREGGETALFFLGMTGQISTADLVMGLGVGAGFLTVIGVLLTVVGVRIPMRPFFAVASVLTFYLCFKFVGTGIHALQIADVVSAQTADHLPESETLGLYPTWQSTLPQLALLMAALGVAVYRRLRDQPIRPVIKKVVTE
jgi:high-affinity iron transporter